MEKAKSENPELEINTLEDAVLALNERNIDSVIEYLKSHPDETVGLCYGTFETYASKNEDEAKRIDRTGLLNLSALIDKLLEKTEK